ncbi:MAG TPA: 16S rRNA (cytidine(1402)-2'-O)-methyltransferase [Gemmatimonadales bacterium]|jgi:16S rRNA (cytidine1402-2'-O)-methyltransferase
MPTGTLYVVATPLGNLEDLSARAVATLRGVDTVAAEDTRRTLGLLSAIDAHPKLLSYHAHSTAKRTDLLVDALLQGRDVALVTDAGTPAISDPGAEIVAAAHAAGAKVVPIAGPSAVAAALSAAGLGGDRYLFLGFLPRKGTARRKLLERTAAEPWPVVFFEAAGRLTELLEDLGSACGRGRCAVVARELTKVHEEIRPGTIDALAAYYSSHDVLGEVTLVLSGRQDEVSESEPDPAEVSAAIADALGAGRSRKDVVTMVSARFGVSRNDAYRMVMERP